MNQALMLMFALGGRMDPKQLQQMIQSGNERRKLLFVKLADILFAAVMFFFADLKLTVKKGDQEVDVQATDKGITTDDKLNAIIGGLMQSDKGNRLREFFRPLIIAAAEILADLLAPNEMIVGLLSGQAGGGANPLIPGPVPGSGSATSNNPAWQYEGRLIVAVGDDRVYHIVNGKKHWVAGPQAVQNRGYRAEQILHGVPYEQVIAMPEGPVER
jgi:hypothetical protein